MFFSLVIDILCSLIGIWLSFLSVFCWLGILVFLLLHKIIGSSFCKLPLFHDLISCSAEILSYYYEHLSFGVGVELQISFSCVYSLYTLHFAKGRLRTLRTWIPWCFLDTLSRSVFSSNSLHWKNFTDIFLLSCWNGMPSWALRLLAIIFVFDEFANKKRPTISKTQLIKSMEKTIQYYTEVTPCFHLCIKSSSKLILSSLIHLFCTFVLLILKNRRDIWLLV